ncbi:SgcJ/EcaC family oxidoreductase [Phytomonospora sp. NPDC050363]|uniref:SgcJ/EcaC family oxidoreductase n=1 Tax=Phytomonospora sp. NPDC050363 TaxID=3155642 RepID=UPI0033F618C9
MSIPRPTVTADVQAITELFETLTTSWAAMDAEAYAAAFTEDADYVTFIGTHLKGRRQIRESHEALWSLFAKNTRLYGKIIEVRKITEDVAVLVTRGAVLKGRRTEPKPAQLKVQTLVALRGADGWRFSAFQNTKHRRLMERFAAKKDPRIAPSAR